MNYRAAMTTFRDAFLAALKESGVGLKEIHDSTGVSLDILKKLSTERVRSTNADDAVKLAAFFGQTLDEFLQSPDGTSPHALALRYMRLPEHLRQRLDIYLEGLEDGAQSERPQSDPEGL